VIGQHELGIGDIGKIDSDAPHSLSSSQSITTALPSTPISRP
jgi:hypothetical protein